MTSKMNNYFIGDRYALLLNCHPRNTIVTQFLSEYEIWGIDHLSLFDKILEKKIKEIHSSASKIFLSCSHPFYGATYVSFMLPRMKDNDKFIDFESVKLGSLNPRRDIDLRKPPFESKRKTQLIVFKFQELLSYTLSTYNKIFLVPLLCSRFNVYDMGFVDPLSDAREKFPGRILNVSEVSKNELYWKGKHLRVGGYERLMSIMENV